MIITTADGSRVTFATVPEPSLGAAPGSMTFTRRRHFGFSAKTDFVTAPNGEVTDSQQTMADSMVAMDCDASLKFQMLVGEYEDLERGVLLAAAPTTITITGSSNIAFSSTGTITLSAGAAGQFAGALPGAVMKISGDGQAANNGYKTIEAVTTTSVVSVMETLVNSATSSAVIKLQFYTNGTTRTSHLGEVKHADLNTFRQLLGMVPSTYEWSAERRGIISGNIGFMLLSEAPADATLDADGNYGAPTLSEPANSTSHLRNVKFRKYNTNGTHDAAITYMTLTKLGVRFTNNARRSDAVAEGQLTPVNIGVGPIKATLSVSAYFQSKEQFLLAFNAVRTSINFQIVDPLGNFKAYYFPLSYMRKYSISEAAVGQDITCDMEFEVSMDNITTQKTVVVSYHMNP